MWIAPRGRVARHNVHVSLGASKAVRALVLPVAFALASGCVAAGILDPAGAPLADLPVVRPPGDFYDVSGEPTSTKLLGLVPGKPFHSLDEIEARMAWWEAEHPGLVDVRAIGASRNGLPLWDVVLTNEARAGAKPVVLFDGGHHGNELAGVEMALYVVDFLLANHATNATVRGWLDALEIHTVPLVNPDGYVASTRGNALGVNLNRNYDLDWGNPLGASNLLMGTLAHAANRSTPSVIIVAENSGPGPFSEPESVAMRDLMEALGDRLVAYLTYHTPTNALAAPWSAYDAPFPLPPEHDAFFEHVLQWTRDHTDYRAGKAGWGNLSAGLPYSASGSSQDFAYATYRVPSFTLEIEIWYTSALSEDYAERVYLRPYAGLSYWLDSSLPIPLYILQNWRDFQAWEIPDEPPPLPDGVPPPRASARERASFLPPDEGAPGDPGTLPGITGQLPWS